jgi:Heparinase II/III N-terminus/Heparinase II/III-like protein
MLDDNTTNRWSHMAMRLAKMKEAEMADRVLQGIRKRLDAAYHQAGVDPSRGEVRRGRCGLGRFFFRGADVPRLAELLRERLPEQVEQIIQQAEKICRHRFDLLGYEGIDYGKPIDWHCDRVHNKLAPRQLWYKVRYLDFAEVGDAKVTWELNRHQHLVTLAKAYRITRDHRYAGELLDQWRHWHAENPYPIGINWASSLEVAIRSLSWTWVYYLLEDTPALTPGTREAWLHAMAISGRHIERYLSTYFSPNTHLLGEAAALFFLGTAFPELRSAARWKRRGWEIIRRELERQVHSDGWDFEQSTYYHVYALDLFLHAGVLASISEHAFPPEYDRKVEKMLEALAVLGRNGPPPRLGDDDGGRVFDPRRNRAEHLLDPLATGAVLFGRGDFKSVASGLREETLWLLGEQGVQEFDRIPVVNPSQASVALPSGGLYLMAGGDPGEQLVIDAGPQGAFTAGHGHADALSLTVNRNSRPLLIDTGTFEYVGGDSERNRFRSTGAHNTLRVDRGNQAETNGPFAWKKLPTVKAEGWINGTSFDLFVGSHDGYSGGESALVHRRWVFFLKSHFWLVRDMALGTGKHQLDLFWHFAPGIEPATPGPDSFHDPGQSQAVSVLTTEGNGWSREVRTEFWSPVYGCREPSPVLHFGAIAHLPAEFVTLFVPVSAERPQAKGNALLKRVGASSAVIAYRYKAAEEEHSFFFGQRGLWARGAWTSDAEFLYVGSVRGRQVLICCNGTFVELAGQRIVSSARPWLRCEVVTSGGKTEVSSSDETVEIAQEVIRSFSHQQESVGDSPVKAGG